MSDPPDARYDAFAEQYARHVQNSPYNAFYERPALLALVGEVAGSRVLDAGCGPGLYAEELVARGASVTAFDESAEMVRLTDARLHGRAEVRRASLAEPLPWLPDESFDLVLMALVLHYVDDRVTALRELSRTLKADGRLVLSTHHPTRDWVERGGSYFTAEVVEETWQDGWQVRFWRQPLHAWCDEFRRAGFLIERLVELQPAPEMAGLYPETFARLSTEPAFIAFSLVKPRLGGTA